MAHPRRHHRISARHRQPGQRIGQSPTVLFRVGQNLPAVGQAGVARQALLDCRTGFCIRGARFAAQGREKRVESGDDAVSGSQPVPGEQQLRRRLMAREQCLVLIAE